MAAPINTELNFTVSISITDLKAIIAEGFPVYDLSSDTSLTHTGTPYTQVAHSYDELSAYADATLDTTIPAWMKEIVSNAADAEGDSIIMVRETFNSRFFYVTVTVTPAV